MSRTNRRSITGGPGTPRPKAFGEIREALFDSRPLELDITVPRVNSNAPLDLLDGSRTATVRRHRPESGHAVGHREKVLPAGGQAAKKVPQPLSIPSHKVDLPRTAGRARVGGGRFFVLGCSLDAPPTHLQCTMRQKTRATLGQLPIKISDWKCSGKRHTLLGENGSAIHSIGQPVHGNSSGVVVIEIRPKERIRPAVSRKKGRVDVQCAESGDRIDRFGD